MPHRNGAAARRGRKHPDKSIPFPKERTRLIQAPAWKPGMTVEEANALWHAWLRIVAGLSQYRG